MADETKPLSELELVIPAGAIPANVAAAMKRALEAAPGSLALPDDLGISWADAARFEKSLAGASPYMLVLLRKVTENLRGWIEGEVPLSDVDAALAEYGVLDAEALLAAIDAASKAGG